MTTPLLDPDTMMEISLIAATDMGRDIALTPDEKDDIRLAKVEFAANAAAHRALTLGLPLERAWAVHRAVHEAFKMQMEGVTQ